MSFDFDNEYSKEWKILGFYYHFDNDNKNWVFIGSQKGIVNFCNLLNNYVLNPINAGISQHEHFGPDSYLKVITWNTPVIKRSGIYGTLEDIKKLAGLIKYKLLNNNNEQIIIDKEYSKNNECTILIKIMEDDFDPSSADPNLTTSV